LVIVLAVAGILAGAAGTLLPVLMVVATAMLLLSVRRPTLKRVRVPISDKPQSPNRLSEGRRRV
jgi:hypothetical protein